MVLFSPLDYMFLHVAAEAADMEAARSHVGGGVVEIADGS